MTASPSWLDPSFFATLLREAERDPRLEVHAVDVQPGVGKGENFVSVLHRCVVDVSKDGQRSQRFLMVKSLPEGEAMLAFVKEGHVFERETHVYTAILPAFRRLQQSSGVAVTPLGCTAYPTSRPHTIVMEDLTLRGYRVAKRQLGLDLAHCLAVVGALARFHALSVGLLQRDPAAFDAHSDRTFAPENRAKCQHYQRDNLEALARAVHAWPGCERFADKLRNADFLDVVITCMQTRDKFSVLTHGDCWINNVMFKSTASSGRAGPTPNDFLFVDFQVCRVASLAFDLQYLLHSSATAEVRAHHRDTLLAAYHDEFSATARSVGVTAPLFTLDELKVEVAHQAAYGLLTAVWVLAVVLAEPEDAPQLAEMPVFEPGVEAQAQQESVMARAYAGARFKEAMLVLLPAFERQGVL